MNLLKIIARRFRRGIAAVYSILMLMVLCGLVSMGVDLGRVQLAKTELRSAADGAARAAAGGLPMGVSQAKTNAAATAAANLCDGSPVVIDQTQDIEFGMWDGTARTFTVLTGSAQNSANAVRVTARRTAARGTAIPLVFARLVGKSTCDINAVSIAKLAGGPRSEFVGLNGVHVHDRTYFLSYSSAVDPNPTITTGLSNADVGSNGSFQFGGNNHIYGDLLMGPSASMVGTTQVTGSTTVLSAPIATPTSPAWSPGANPGGISQNYTVSSDTTLPGGTYWFTSLSISKNLTFSGPATVYVNGDVDMSADEADLRAYNSIPSNLKIYQIGSHTFGGNRNELTIIADVEAPGSDFSAHDDLVFKGNGIFDSIDLHDDCHFFADETSGVGTNGVRISLVK
jgi:Flp pilus assembly protein TadG